MTHFLLMACLIFVSACEAWDETMICGSSGYVSSIDSEVLTCAGPDGGIYVRRLLLVSRNGDVLARDVEATALMSGMPKNSNYSFFGRSAYVQNDGIVLFEFMDGTQNETGVYYEFRPDARMEMRWRREFIATSYSVPNGYFGWVGPEQPARLECGARFGRSEGAIELPIAINQRHKDFFVCAEIDGTLVAILYTSGRPRAGTHPDRKLYVLDGAGQVQELSIEQIQGVVEAIDVSRSGLVLLFSKSRGAPSSVAEGEIFRPTWYHLHLLNPATGDIFELVRFDFIPSMRSQQDDRLYFDPIPDCSIPLIIDLNATSTRIQLNGLCEDARESHWYSPGLNAVVTRPLDGGASEIRMTQVAEGY